MLLPPRPEPTAFALLLRALMLNPLPWALLTVASLCLVAALAEVVLLKITSSPP